jgi:trehalose utilization protein
MSNLRVTVWNEFRHEKSHEAVQKIYPNGIHNVIADGLREHGLTNVRTATLDEPENGLPDSILAETDVLLWWGHMAHRDVADETVDRVQARVLEGMGLVVLHSGHHSKIFKRLMGTSCSLRWREAGENERIWIVSPGHPIAEGLEPYIDIPEEEMYGEHFDIPTPDELVMVSWFKGGEIFRSKHTRPISSPKCAMSLPMAHAGLHPLAPLPLPMAVAEPPTSRFRLRHWGYSSYRHKQPSSKRRQPRGWLLKLSALRNHPP